MISQGGLDDLLESFCSDDDDDEDDQDSSSDNQENNNDQPLLKQINNHANSNDIINKNEDQLFSPKMNPPNSNLVLPTATPLVISNNNYQL